MIPPVSQNELGNFENMHRTPNVSMQEEELRELQGTATLDKMEGKVQVPADAPTQVGRATLP